MNTLNISKRAAGKAGEDYAAKMLEANGCRILCRNYTGLNGEIDIIAENGAYILFTEVKLRRFLTQKPALAVDNKKMLHIVNTANEFLCEYKDNNYLSSLSVRFDIFEVFCSKGKIVGYNLIPDAFSPAKPDINK